MSLDANYLLCYDNLGYISPTPMEKDTTYLKEKYGGEFHFITDTNIYWSKPKYTLLPDEIESLMADQVLERKDCELWEIVKGK
jgi:hypothetical protein